MDSNPTPVLTMHAKMSQTSRYKMTTPSKSWRKPFTNRPWITGGLYDTLARKSILHCDAQVIDAGALKYLVIDWRRAGSERVALDAYLIEDDGLTPLWDATLPHRTALGLLTWGAPGVPWAALHARVVEQAATAQDAGEASGNWARVSLLCHYVPAPDTDCEIVNNKYASKLPDLI